MELSEKKIELVGIYLQGGLKEDELSDFLKEVEQNALLKEELAVQQAILEGIEHKNNQELRARLKRIGSEKKETNSDTKIFSLPFIKIIASVAAIALLCFASYFLLNTSSDTESLFANYFKPSELTITRSTDIEADLVQVKEYYNTQQYDQAVPIFKKIIDTDASSSNLRLAYGNSLLKCNKFDDARAEYTYILDSNDPLYSDQSRWYLALLELKVGNIDKAKEYLKLLVSDGNSDFYQEANALIGELETLR